MKKGLVIITGRAHPGIVKIVHHALGVRSLRPYLVKGGSE